MTFIFAMIFTGLLGFGVGHDKCMSEQCKPNPTKAEQNSKLSHELE